MLYNILLVRMEFYWAPRSVTPLKDGVLCRMEFYVGWSFIYYKDGGLLNSIGEGNGNPLQCSCLEDPRDGGAWWAAIYGVAQSRTRLKRLSSSSSSIQCFSFVSLQQGWGRGWVRDDVEVGLLCYKRGKHCELEGHRAVSTSGNFQVVKCGYDPIMTRGGQVIKALKSYA